MNGELSLIVLAGAEELGKSVDEHLMKVRKSKKSYMVDHDAVRFSNGEGKVVINESIREKDIYILADVGNYSCTYMMHNFINHMSPDDHFRDIKRVIYANHGHAKSISVVTPLLYESRQHRRKGRESLDAAAGVQELFDLGIKNLITFDCHDVGLQNAVPFNSFENFYPTANIIKKFIDTEKIDFRNMLIISPDMGATGRARLFADLFKVNVGMFYKRRDLTKVVNGKNPVVEHKYIGESVSGKNVLICDDMIASGGSILEAASELRKLGAKNVYLTVTFSLFTSGVEVIEDAYKNGLFNKIYTTNLTYIPEEIKSKEWIEVVDCSWQVAQIIDYLNRQMSISELMNGEARLSLKINKNIGGIK